MTRCAIVPTPRGNPRAAEPVGRHGVHTGFTRGSHGVQPRVARVHDAVKDLICVEFILGQISSLMFEFMILSNSKSPALPDRGFAATLDFRASFSYRLSSMNSSTRTQLFIVAVCKHA